MEETSKPVRRRSFLHWAISIVIVIAALPFLCLIANQVIIAWAMTHWLSTGIKLPDDSGRVRFMVQAKSLHVAEFDRQIKVESKSFPSTTLIVPIDGCGAMPVDVYWYPADRNEGPYLRFIDPRNEYVLDLMHGGIRQVARIDGRIYIGDCTDDLSTWEIGNGYSRDGKEYIEFGGIASPVPKAAGLLAKSDGCYIGSITYSELRCQFKKTKPSVSWQDRDDL